MMPSPKPSDFPASARRHLADAELLEANGRSPNAGHLYGFAAECGLKALLIWHGHPTEADGSPKHSSGFRKHINELVIPGTIASLRLFLHRRSGARYLAMLSSVGNFSDWRTDHRYYSEAALPLGSFCKWKTAAREVGRMLDQARIEGKK